MLRKLIKVRELPSGDHLNVDYFYFKGSNQYAPKVYIQAGIHGEEVQGSATIYELLKYFAKNPPLGDVTLVPLCNPWAANQKSGAYTPGRFCSVTGNNWNRLYENLTIVDERQRTRPYQINVQDFYEECHQLDGQELKKVFRQKLLNALDEQLTRLDHYELSDGKLLCLHLQKMAVSADIVLDIHTAYQACYYIYSPEYALESAKKFHIPHVLSIPNSFDGALDEATFCSWWNLNEVMIKNDRKDYRHTFEAFTLEFQNHETLSLHEAKDEVKSILNYLTAKEVVTCPSEDYLPKKVEYTLCELKNFKKLHSPYGGLVHYNVKPGDFVKKGEDLCYFVNFQEINSIQDLTDKESLKTMKASEDMIIINCFPSATIHQGTSIFNVFTKTKSM